MRGEFVERADHGTVQELTLAGGSDRSMVTAFAGLPGCRVAGTVLSTREQMTAKAML